MATTNAMKLMQYKFNIFNKYFTKGTLYKIIYARDIHHQAVSQFTFVN